MNFETFVTIVGAVMAMGHFPQFHKMFVRKSTADISLLTYGLFFSGHIVWLLYAFDYNNWPLVVSNSISLFGTGLIFGLASLHLLQKRKAERVAGVTNEALQSRG